MEPIAVKFVAEVRKVQSMSDHSVNVTINLPEYHGDEAAWFLKNQLALVEIVAVLKEDET